MMNAANGSCLAACLALIGLSLALASGIGLEQAGAEFAGRAATVRNAERVIVDENGSAKFKSSGRAKRTSMQGAMRQVESAGIDVQEAIRRHHEAMWELMSSPQFPVVECK